MAGAQREDLLERDDERRALTDALESAQAGHGRLVVVDGEPGIGKSSLLSDTRRQAAAAGMRVLAATGLELERDFAFGLAARLFEPSLADLDEVRRRGLLRGGAAVTAELFEHRVTARMTGGVDHGYALVQGLRTLTMGLTALGRTEREPLLLVVDDAQWADRPSLRFLVHLSADLDVHPVVVLVAARRNTPDVPPELTHDLIGVLRARVLTLRPLSATAVETLVRGVYPDATAELSAEYARVTGENPFYLHELLELAQDEGLPTTGEVTGLVPQSVIHSVLGRLTRLGAPAASLASAVAVLGDGTSLRHVAKLAELDDETAERVADALSDAHILRAGDPLSFAHPLIGAAVRTDMPALARSRAHRRAADILKAERAPVAAVAAQLMACRPAGDPSTVRILRSAAEQASSRGSFQAAQNLLERALAEPPAPAERADLLVDLALAQAAAGASDAVDRLRAALDVVADPPRRVKALRALARMLFARSEFDQAAAVIDQALRESQLDEPTASALAVDSLAITSVGRSPRPAAVARMTELLDDAREGRSPAEPGFQAQLAGSLLATGRPAPEVSGVARAALARLPGDDGFYGVITGFAVVALLSVDDFDAAHSASETALQQAHASGSLITAGIASHWRTMLRYYRGDLDGAIADARYTLEIGRAGFDICAGWTAPLLAHAHMDSGDLDAAADAVAVATEAHADRPEHVLALLARGRLTWLAGDPVRALAELEAAGAQAERFSLTQPTILPWRSAAGLVAMTVGQQAKANQLVQIELAQARAIGAPRTLGVALRSAGTVRGGQAGVKLLTEAVEVLERSPATLELARALVALGTERRRSGDPTASRDPLRHGLQLAESLGAHPLAARAQHELRAAGGRRRLSRRQSDGPSLTSSEHRIAQLAGQGLTTPQIAHTLYLTPKTIDWHLGNVYRKLGVASRRELSAVLPRDSSEDPPPHAAHNHRSSEAETLRQARPRS